MCILFTIDDPLHSVTWGSFSSRRAIAKTKCGHRCGVPRRATACPMGSCEFSTKMTQDMWFLHGWLNQNDPKKIRHRWLASWVLSTANRGPVGCRMTSHWCPRSEVSERRDSELGVLESRSEAVDSLGKPRGFLGFHMFSSIFGWFPRFFNDIFGQRFDF